MLVWGRVGGWDGLDGGIEPTQLGAPRAAISCAVAPRPPSRRSPGPPGCHPTQCAAARPAPPTHCTLPPRRPHPAPPTHLHTHVLPGTTARSPPLPLWRACLPSLVAPRRPDIVHCHDWQSAPCAWLDHGSSKVAFTIHNLNYGADLIGQVRGAGLRRL